MIYLSSDWHMTENTIGSVTEKLSRLYAGDTVLVLGDLCNEWKAETGTPWFAEELAKMSCRILFLDGNHDDMGYLDRLPTEECCGAKGHWIAPNLFHIARGEALELEGRTFLTLGGGYSGAGYISRHPDIWQPREMPSQGELDRGIESCVHYGFAFDYVLSHCAPLSVLLNQKLSDEYNSLHAYLEGIQASVSRKQWFFGHYHGRQSFDGGFELICQDLLQLPE